jgi:Na+/melibiose symporter-like transporter
VSSLTSHDSYIVVGVLTMLMYFVRDNVNAIFVLAGFIGFFDGVSNVARMSCLADCVEYGEWKTGNRAEGMVFSTNVFKTKLSGALAAYLLAGIGFVANQPQAESTLNWMVLFFTLILGAGSIAAILPLLKYELTESRFARIVAELHSRKNT